jgi:nucleotide-binding universal stress UspA family protein
MIKTILVPLDGSERAEYALPVAARLARHTGSTLALIRVVNNAPYYSMMQATVDAKLEEVATYLDKVAAETPLAELDVTTMARHGAVVPAILIAAADYKADLIVMCSHGRTGLAHVIMGSVAETIAHYASLPVLIVREKDSLSEAPVAENSHPLRVLVPLDGTAHAEAVLEPAVALLTALASPAQKKAIHLVRVVKSTPYKNDEMRAAEKYLSIFTDHLTKHIPVSWSVVSETDIARAIAETGADTNSLLVFEDCDLIAMSTHGREGLPFLAMGSITERVLHSTKCPLLVFRPPEKAED